MLGWGLLTVGVMGLSGGGWYANDYIHNKLASKDAVLVAGAKADFVIDRQMESVISQINHIESKRKKTREDFSQLEYLRKQLEIMRQIRRGK